jgi:hypothetical protein
MRETPLTVRQLGNDYLVEDVQLDAVVAVFQNKRDAEAAAISINIYVTLRANGA